MSGANPKVVQQRLGHHSAAFTLDVYTTVLAGLERESALRAADFIRFTLEERAG
jgi:integrase